MYAILHAEQQQTSAGGPHRAPGRLLPKLQLSLHTSLSTLPACHALPAQEQPQACLPSHCRTLLSNNPTAAGRHRPQGGVLHVSSAAEAACVQAAAAQLVQQSQQASGHCQQKKGPRAADAAGQVVDARKFVPLLEKARVAALEQLPQCQQRQPELSMMQPLSAPCWATWPLSGCMSCVPAPTLTSAVLSGWGMPQPRHLPRQQVHLGGNSGQEQAQGAMGASPGDECCDLSLARSHHVPVPPQPVF